MNIVVNKVHKVLGKTKVPGDKSISHRSIMIGSISKGETYINNLLLSDDVKSTINCFENLGVFIERKNNYTIVKGLSPKKFKIYNKKLDAGNSGTTARLLLGLISGSNNGYCFTGDSSLKNRPMKRVTDPLIKMGADIKFLDNENLLPIAIKGGNLKGITYRLPVASAQVKSAIILAGLQAQGTTVIEEPKISRDHTEIMINYFGGNVKKIGNCINVKGEQSLIGDEVFIPGDISSASFFIVLALIVPESELLIENVGLNPTRTGIIDALITMGANIKVISEKIANGEKYGDILVKSSKLQGTTIEGNMIPRLIDEIPILAVAATIAEGKTIIKNAEELKVKESNRIKSMVNELKKMGSKIEETKDGMIIEGPTKLIGTTVESNGDHRIAMAMVIAGMVAEGHTKVLDSESIHISFPEFEKTLKEITK